MPVLAISGVLREVVRTAKAVKIASGDISVTGTTCANSDANPLKIALMKKFAQMVNVQNASGMVIVTQLLSAFPDNARRKKLSNADGELTAIHGRCKTS